MAVSNSVRAMAMDLAVEWAAQTEEAMDLAVVWVAAWVAVWVLVWALVLQVLVWVLVLQELVALVNLAAVPAALIKWATLLDNSAMAAHSALALEQQATVLRSVRLAGPQTGS